MGTSRKVAQLLPRVGNADVGRRAGTGQLPSFVGRPSRRAAQFLSCMGNADVGRRALAGELLSSVGIPMWGAPGEAWMRRK